MGKIDEIAELAARLGDQAPAPQYIRAYHASPYDFNKFDASKIGTGEGNQAYGHGLYFAQSPAVMEQYYHQFKRLRPNTSGKWSARTVKDAEETVAKAGSVDVAIQHLRALLPSVGEDMSLRPQVEDAIAYLQRGKAPRARRYEVEIGVPETSLLDWDRPLKSQGALVAEGLAPFRRDKYGLGPNDEADYETGATALHRIASAFDDDMSEASAALLNAGIPGIRYLDYGSRSSGQGTRNYVIFPGAEDKIRILRKFAVPGAIGAGAAGGMQDQQ